MYIHESTWHFLVFQKGNYKSKLGERYLEGHESS